jgi:hypothetical protein
MSEYLHYRAAIYEHEKDYGAGWGSGSLLRLRDRVFIPDE